METKECKKCGRKLPVEMFVKNKTRKDGLSNWCRECNSVYKAKYRVEHAEEISEAKKRCYNKNKGHYHNKKLEYYYTHREECIKISLDWRNENRDRCNKTHRDFRKNHHELVLQRERNYREIHRELVLNTARKYNWEKVHRYCIDNTKIENYELAKAEKFKGWNRHHRLETHNSEGIKRLVQITPAELKALDMYYDRPPEELIWLRTSEHAKLHKE